MDTVLRRQQLTIIPVWKRSTDLLQGVLSRGFITPWL